MFTTIGIGTQFYFVFILCYMQKVMDFLRTILYRKCLNENSPERIQINKLTLLTKQKLTLALLALIYFPRACMPFISAKS